MEERTGRTAINRLIIEFRFLGLNLLNWCAFSYFHFHTGDKHCSNPGPTLEEAQLLLEWTALCKVKIGVDLSTFM